MHELYKNIPCVYFSASADGFISEANDTLSSLLGYTRDEIAGMKLEGILTLASRIFQQTHFYPLLQLKGHAEEIYITLKTKEGEELPVLMNAVKKEEDTGVSLHFAGITVTKRKKFEDEIIAAKKAAERALKENTALKEVKDELQKRAEELDRQIALVNRQNQELKQFSFLATHTLQEPLRKLMFFTSQVTEEEEVDTPAVLEKIARSTHDINAKLKGLQEYLWLTDEDQKWEKVDVEAITESARKEVESENPGVSVVLESEPIPAIEGNMKNLTFLVKELFSNAVHFRKPGNVVNVRIQASTVLLNQFRQLTGKYKYTEFARLRISDDGVGFDDKYQEQAFELFRKLHPAGGLGIGLALCRKIAENHDGSISLESRRNVGTTATILLPLRRDKPLL